MDVSVVEVASGVWQARAQHVCWVLIVDGDGVTLVDTGYPGDKERVIASLGKIGRAPADVDAVVLTHAHPDHIGSAEYFRSQVGRPVWVHEQEKANATGEHVEQVSIATLLTMAWRPSVLVWFVQAGIGLKAAQVQRLGAVETYSAGALDVPGHPLAVHTPGHTFGHAVLHLPDRGVLVAGDALMTEHTLASSTGPQLLPDFFNTDTTQARASLELLRPLGADVVIPGHAPAFHAPRTRPSTSRSSTHSPPSQVPAPLRRLWTRGAAPPERRLQGRRAERIAHPASVRRPSHRPISSSVDLCVTRAYLPVVRAMVLKEFRELRRDRRTMAMIVFLPILLLVVFGYAANFKVDEVSTALLGAQVERAGATLPDAFAVVTTDADGTEQTAADILSRNTADVAILTGTRPVQIYVDGSALFSAQAAVSAFNRLGDQVEVEVLFNPDLQTSWVMVPGIVGLILMFVGTVVTSIGLVKERERGTLEQLAVMPIRPSTVILGKISPYFLLASLDMVVVTLLGMLLFDVPFTGNVAAFTLGAALFLFVVLGIGVFISTISVTVGQAIQTAFFFLLPQILLSGFIFPLDAIPWGVRWISYLLPLTYFTQISQGIMLRGAPIDSLWLPFLALTLMAVVVFAGAVLRFRRSLTPGTSRRRHAVPA